MSIEFSCTNCGVGLRVPEEQAANRVQCGSCGSMQTAPSSNGYYGTQGPTWDPGQQPEVNPYATSIPDQASTVPPPYQHIKTRESAQSSLTPPAIFILALCGLQFIIYALGAVGLAIDIGQGAADPDTVSTLIMLACGILSTSFAMFGAYCMLRMKNFPMAIVGGICALVSGVGCCFLPTIFAVWGLAATSSAKQFFE